jgi:NTP pyrophosphatase (non-canonical NTP hydrolase)
MKSLSFTTLRHANLQRLPLFKNSKGKIAHAAPDGSDWSLAEWLESVVGELGEYANNAKKFRRGDINGDEFKALAAKELADVQIYLDILAYRCGVDLGAATRAKFNEVSFRVGAPIYIGENDQIFTDHELNEPLTRGPRL